MQRKEIEKFYIKKIIRLKKYDKAYFEKDNPLISDGDYDKIKQFDQITIKDLNNFSENKTLVGIINHEDDTSEEIILIHSYNNSQIEWFKQGSALNVLRSRIS